MIDKPCQRPLLPATDSTLGPGDFPLGSLESRAATRAMLENAEREPREVLRVRIIQVGSDEPPEILEVPLTDEFGRRLAPSHPIWKTFDPGL